MTTFAIAGLQLSGQPGDNTASMLEEIDKVMIRFPWIEMIVLPELMACGADRSLAESLPGPTEARFRASARSHGIWLIPGSLFEAAGEPKKLRWTDGQHVQPGRAEIVEALLRIADEERPFYTADR